MIMAALFDLWTIVTTPGAMEATTDRQRRELLARHAGKDWGVVGEEGPRG